MKLAAYNFRWRPVLTHPFHAPGALLLWWTLFRNKYGLEVAPNRFRLFPLSHIVLTDHDLRDWE